MTHLSERGRKAAARQGERVHFVTAWLPARTGRFAALARPWLAIRDRVVQDPRVRAHSPTRS